MSPNHKHVNQRGWENEVGSHAKKPGRFARTLEAVEEAGAGMYISLSLSLSLLHNATT